MKLLGVGVVFVYTCDVAFVYTWRETETQLMPKSLILGELEQLVLLVILRLGEDAYAINARKELEEVADKSVTRGALYRTFDRLRDKGYLDWQQEQDAPRRGGHPRRHFSVTASGLKAVQDSRAVLTKLWSGIEEVQ